MGNAGQTRDPFQLLLLGPAHDCGNYEGGATKIGARAMHHAQLCGDRSGPPTSVPTARGRSLHHAQLAPNGCRFAGGCGPGQRLKVTPYLSEVVSARACASHAAHAHRFVRHWVAQARAVVGIRSKQEGAGSLRSSLLLICLLAACRTPSLDDHPPIEPTRSTNTTTTIQGSRPRGLPRLRLRCLLAAATPSTRRREEKGRAA